MKPTENKIWILLAYLVLMWNVGPGLHYAKFSGLHHGVNTVLAPFGFCACDHGSDFVDLDFLEAEFLARQNEKGESENDAKQTNASDFADISVLSSPTTSGLPSAACDSCAFCDFLKQFHSNTLATLAVDFSVRVEFQTIFSQSAKISSLLRASSRGPPVLA